MFSINLAVNHNLSNFINNIDTHIHTHSNTKTLTHTHDYRWNVNKEKKAPQMKLTKPIKET